MMPPPKWPVVGEEEIPQRGWCTTEIAGGSYSNALRPV